MAQRLQVIGLLHSVNFHKAKDFAEELFKTNPELYHAPESVGMFEFQWKQLVDQLKRDHPEDLHHNNGDALIFRDKEIVTLDPNLTPEQVTHYRTIGKEAFAERITSDKCDYVFMDISIGQDPAGRLVFELYKDICPKTCANFVALCTGEQGSSEDGTRLSYTDSRFHRVVRNGWLQGGDICDGSGARGMSVYGAVFQDECFAVEHDSRGVLGMVNHGRNTNNSQFYVTLAATPWMNRQYVAFGRVVEGTSVLERLENVGTKNERPLDVCRVSKCGVLLPRDLD